MKCKLAYSTLYTRKSSRSDSIWFLKKCAIFLICSYLTSVFFSSLVSKELVSEMRNLVTRVECETIIRKLVDNESNEVEVIDYDISNYCDGFPGFLGEYYSLKINVNEVREITIR